MVPHAAVVGAGPNGLTAALSLARAGWQVTVYEAGAEPGGASASAELFGAGLISDLGASVHPFSAASPAYASLLPPDAVQWAHPEIPAAHGIDGGAPALLHADLHRTLQELGPDAGLWRRITEPLVENWPAVREAMFTPPSTPFARRSQAGVSGLWHRGEALLQLGSIGMLPAAALMRTMRTERARALFAGLAAHSTSPLTHPLTSLFGRMFAAAAHTAGWPMVRGGSGRLVEALVHALKAHGGHLVTSTAVEEVAQVRRGGNAAGGDGHAGQGWLVKGSTTGRAGRRRGYIAEQAADVLLLDLTPAQAAGLKGLPLGAGARRAMLRWNYGPAVVKIDYLLRGPIPWRQPELAKAGTVHLGGSAGQIIASESAAHRGVLPSRPYVLLAQPSAADSSRTPDERTVAWAYAHVPHGLSGSGVERAAGLLEQEISRQAPGFGDAVLQRRVWSPGDLQGWNPNLVGGSLSAGVASLGQTFSGPVSIRRPYSAGVPGVYLCSAATAPGGGAHGMCGFNAAQAALQDWR